MLDSRANARSEDRGGGGVGVQGADMQDPSMDAEFRCGCRISGRCRSIQGQMQDQVLSRRRENDILKDVDVSKETLYKDPNGPRAKLLTCVIFELFILVLPPPPSRTL